MLAIMDGVPRDSAWHKTEEEKKQKLVVTTGHRSVTSNIVRINTTIPFHPISS
jgi:hypothetical protein